MEDLEGKSFHFVVRSATTHTALYSGRIIPQKSQYNVLNNKTENIEVRTFNLNPKTNKLESHIIKIQITNEKVADSHEFCESLRQIIEGEGKSE